MPTIDPVADIKDRLQVETLVGEYVVLKRAGINFKGLCPFHQEKTPSFMVSPERRSWHCFGCSKGGDIFSFIMEMEGLEFREALQLLARKAGVELPERSAGDRARSGHASRLAEINAAAQTFFEQQLLADTRSAAVARDELARRKVDQLTRETFHIGFASSGSLDAKDGSGRSSWTELVDYLRKKGYSDKDMIASGIAVARTAPKQGVYDRFRNRLMFPLIDVVGRTVGFSARALDPQEKMGKYINSPESEVYHKGKFLFALAQAKSEIRERDFVVLVEGQMDAISSHRVGVKNVVATSGTALTAEQLRLLKRYTTNLILAFDVDPAGSDATKRGIDLAIAQGFSVKVARMPSDVDPDDLCREDPKAWATALNQSERIVDHYIRLTTEGQDLSRVEIKKKVSATVLPEIVRLTDPVEQTHYLQRLSSLLHVEESVLRDSMRTTMQSNRSDSSQIADEIDQNAAPAKNQIIDPLLRKVARLVAIRVRAGALPQDAVAPLSVLEAKWVTSVISVLTREQSQQALLEHIAKVSQPLARLVDAEVFALDRELEYLGGAATEELPELIRTVTREGIRRELKAMDYSAAGQAERFVQKTRELAKLDQAD